MHIETFHVDFADSGRPGHNLERVHIDAELVKGDKRRCSVLLQQGKFVDIHGKRERIEAYAFNRHFSTDKLFGMGYYVILDESRGEFEGRKNEDNQGDKGNQDNLNSFFHAN